MEIYSSSTSEIIRHDFTRFNRRSSKAEIPVQKEDAKVDEKMRESLEQYRSDTANDNGMSSYGTYKCPIF